MDTLNERNIRCSDFFTWTDAPNRWVWMMYPGSLRRTDALLCCKILLLCFTRASCAAASTLFKRNRSTGGFFFLSSSSRPLLHLSSPRLSQLDHVRIENKTNEPADQSPVRAVRTLLFLLPSVRVLSLTSGPCPTSPAVFAALHILWD